MPTSSALREFARDPSAYLPPHPHALVTDDPRFHLRLSPDGAHATLCRIRTDDVAAMFADVSALAPAVEGVEVRRVESYDDFLLALALSNEGWGVPNREDPAAIWERRRSRPGGEWIALVDEEPVAFAGAIAGERGLFLTGGVTLPRFRGRGAYRALVRARWDEAVRLGTPGLVVHAEEASRRVLVRIGFEEVGRVVELVSG